AAQTEVALVRNMAVNGLPDNFSDCLPLQTGAYIAGAGVYLLTIAPARGAEGRALTNGLNAAQASCNTDTIITAIQFRLIQISPPITAGELQDPKLRNLVAHKCFGTSDTITSVEDAANADVRQWGLL